MLRIIIDGCVRGYGYVVDYLGDIWFYGTIDECGQFIVDMEAV